MNGRPRHDVYIEGLVEARFISATRPRRDAPYSKQYAIDSSSPHSGAPPFIIPLPMLHDHRLDGSIPQGAGLVGFKGRFNDPVEVQKWVDIMVKHGQNSIDTSRMYCEGTSEAVRTCTAYNASSF